MSYHLGETAREILELIKGRFKAHGMKLESLNVYRAGAADIRRGLLNGNKEPSQSNLGTISHALFELIESPRKAGESPTSAAKFLEQFVEDLNRACPTSRGQEWEANLLTLRLCADCGIGESTAAGGAGRFSNPFFWRKAITDPAGFFNRERELDQLRTAVTVGQPVQIVGPRRIGKTSLLLAAGRELGHWLNGLPKPPLLAHVDMMNAACHTLDGWLRFVAGRWGWKDTPRDLAAFSERVYDALGRGSWLVLCLDECEKFIGLPSAFDLEFFENLRSLSSGAVPGFCILTASRISLRAIREQGGMLSPYYNTFQRLTLGEFSPGEASSFLKKRRAGLAPFIEEEQTRMLSFAGGHPLKLQLAGYHVVEARENDRSMDHSLAVAATEIPEPQWEGHE